MKSLLIIFAALLLMFATPYVFNAIDDALTESYSQTVSGITTAAGVYSANVTLGQSAYNDSVTSLTAISSNVTTDIPTAASYNSTSKVALVSGLDADATRSLTFAYLIEETSLPVGAPTTIGLLRWFYIFIIIGVTVGAIYAFFQT